MRYWFREETWMLKIFTLELDFHFCMKSVVLFSWLLSFSVGNIIDFPFRQIAQVRKRSLKKSQSQQIETERFHLKDWSR